MPSHFYRHLVTLALFSALPGLCLVVPEAAAQTVKTVMVRHASKGVDAGRVDLLNATNGSLLSSLPLRCDRAHVGANVLACLHSVAGQGLKFDLADRQGKVGFTLSFPNVLSASRVRVARDGAMAAFTGFTAGHSYVGTDFSTRTYLVDVNKKRILADVSTFKVIETAQLKLAGKRINVWGVSFDPLRSNRFVATVGAAGQVFLAEGDIGQKTLSLLRAEMECPSISPDGKRIAFKRRNGAGGWLPAVYEIATGRELVIKEVRSVDDQIEWLDNATLLYELEHSPGAGSNDGDVMKRNADGSGSSILLRRDAGSPAALD